MSFNWKASGLFAAGVAFGTAGIKILSSPLSLLLANMIRFKSASGYVYETIRKKVQEIADCGKNDSKGII